MHSIPTCPDCEGPMWDNRPKKEAGEFSPKSPDFKCKDKECGGVIWPGETVETKFAKAKKIMNGGSDEHGIEEIEESGGGTTYRKQQKSKLDIPTYAAHAGRIFAAAWEESKNAMALIPSKDGEEMSAYEWNDLRLRIAQGFAIEINKIIRKERF